MNNSAYNKNLVACRQAAKSVAEESMNKAAEKTKAFYEVSDDGLTDVSISGDGTWCKWGFKSSFGVVTAISLMTGRV